MNVSQLICALALSCWIHPGIPAPPASASAVPAAPTVRTTQADPFPVPPTGLAITVAQEEATTLLDLLLDFARVSGQTLHVSDETRTQLRQTPLGLLTSVEVPPAEVYSFVESLLWQSGFVVIDERAAAPRMLAIKSLHGSERVLVRQGCVTVPASELAAYKRHPALMIQTVVPLSDAHRGDLQGALRMFVVDNHVQRVATAGNGVLLAGTGRQVAQAAEVLRALDALGPVERERNAETKQEEPKRNGR